MTQVTLSGTELALQPEEELVPCDHWLSWLKNLALECVRKAHLALKTGWKYSAAAFWMVLIAHAMLNRALDDAADRINKLLWKEFNARRRHKATARRYAGKRKRQERKCPNGDQVRKYRNALPDWVVCDLNRFILRGKWTMHSLRSSSQKRSTFSRTTRTIGTTGCDKKLRE